MKAEYVRNVDYSEWVSHLAEAISQTRADLKSKLNLLTSRTIKGNERNPSLKLQMQDKWIEYDNIMKKSGHLDALLAKHEETMRNPSGFVYTLNGRGLYQHTPIKADVKPSVEEIVSPLISYN